MDQAEIQAWLDYCTGVSAEEPDISSIFIELFSNRLTEQDKDDLRTVFNVVPNSARALNRMFQMDDIVSSKSNEEISDIVRSDLFEMKKLVRSDNLIKAMDGYPIVFTIDDKYFSIVRNSITNRQYYHEKSCSISPLVDGAGPIIQLLCGAFYGVAFNVNLQHVFIADLINLEVNFDNYFQLYKIGVDYVFK